MSDDHAEGYAQGYDDGYADAHGIAQAAMDDLLDRLRVVLWHHHERLRSRDWRLAPRKVLTMYATTLADIRKVVGE